MKSHNGSAAGPVVVYLGPSLRADEARDLLRAQYLGPVRCGDILRIRRTKPRAIGIVDGLFESTSAVWHKEILLAIEDGIDVFGASSMGALRAAELATFGMVGLGKIFEVYRNGTYIDDDEVALLHAPAASGYAPLSEAMVNIRATVASAVAAGVISAESGDRVIRCAKDTFYQERSFATAISTHGAAAQTAKKRAAFAASSTPAATSIRSGSTRSSSSSTLHASRCGRAANRDPQLECTARTSFAVCNTRSRATRSSPPTARFRPGSMSPTKRGRSAHPMLCYGGWRSFCLLRMRLRPCKA